MRELREGDLLAAAMPPGPEWLHLLTEAWSAGAAVLLIDHRLPKPEVDRILATARPTALFDGSDVHRQSEGVPVDEGIALVVATSGTTGPPKLAELGHDALRAAVDASATRLGATPEDPWLCCLPVAHIGGLLVLLRGLLLGAPVTVHEAFDTGSFERAVLHGARFTSLVPTMLVRLIREQFPLSGLRAILVGGAALTFDAPGTPVVATYGMTETCGGVVYDGVPLDGVEVRIGAEDRIEIRSPTLLRGYRLGAEPAFASDGWFATGDAGVLENGRLRVLGRLDDVVITGGEKVWPAEVEAALRSAPAVAEVRVAGRPDPEWGARVVAFVVPSDPASPPTLEELREAVADRLPRYNAPRELVLMESLSP